MCVQFKCWVGLACVMLTGVCFAQGPMRGSIVEDRAARKLLEAGDTRYDADETEKAVEVWQSVIERYPQQGAFQCAHAFG